MNNTTFNDLFEERGPETDYWTLMDLKDLGPKKHVAFLISDQHLIPHGGIGQFAKAFSEMCLRLQWRCDIITDKIPTNDFVKSFVGVRVYAASNTLSYKDHSSTFMYTEGVNYEKCYNFQQSIKLATQQNQYDLFVANTLESVISAYTNACKPLVSYTHLYRSIFRDADNGKFLDSFHEIQDKMNEMPDIIVGTQSILNKQQLDKHVKDCRVLPMPMPERNLLLSSKFDTRKGVLYIGRWEEGKRPKLFLDLCKQAHLPIRVITNKNGAKKFAEECDKLGITDYEIRAGITSQEKVDFITSSAIHLNCSKLESYCFAMFECIGHMPCIALDDQSWSDSFDSRFLMKVSKNECVEALQQLYHCVNLGLCDLDEQIYCVNQLDFDAEKNWKNLL